jgi:sigma-B regulation protein RsbU (phosphoserine phosphatase)
LRANELILKDSASDLFLTAAYALLELEKGRMIYANAGHTRPLLYRSASRQVLQLAGRGTVLGAFENIRLEERRVDLAPGDVLVFYTDGVIETQDDNGAFFEESRLHDVLSRHATAPASEIAAALDEAVLAFQGSADQFDDVACVVVKRA